MRINVSLICRTLSFYLMFLFSAVIGAQEATFKFPATKQAFSRWFTGSRNLKKEIGNRQRELEKLRRLEELERRRSEKAERENREFLRQREENRRSKYQQQKRWKDQFAARTEWVRKHTHPDFWSRLVEKDKKFIWSCLTEDEQRSVMMGWAKHDDDLARDEAVRRSQQEAQKAREEQKRKFFEQRREEEARKKFFEQERAREEARRRKQQQQGSGYQHQPLVKTHYMVLGVNPNASERDIKQAYYKLALRFHPDKNSGDSAAADKFKEVGGAYAVLSDPDDRKKYDLFLNQTKVQQKADN